MTAEHADHSHQILATLAIFKILKACGMLIVGFGLLSGLGADFYDLLDDWLSALPINASTPWLHNLLANIELIQPNTWKWLSLGAFGYAAIYLIEGIGLWYEQRWAELLTVIVTCSFVPFEVYELIKHATGIKLAVILVNLLIIAYLLTLLRSQRTAKT